MAGTGGLVITDVDAWEILDSRGRPTVCCKVSVSSRWKATASVPSGMSVGRREAVERRDGGSRYGGLGVRSAVDAVRGPLRQVAVGRDPADQEGLDQALVAADGSPDLSRLGANAVLSVSLATLIAASVATDLPLYRRLGAAPSIPLPMVNILSGGAHAGGMIDIQDILAVPVGATTFASALEMASAVRAGTASVAADHGHSIALVADEGGLAVPLGSNAEATEMVCSGIERAGLRPGTDVPVGLDAAATQFFHDGQYVLGAEGRRLGVDEWVDLLDSWRRTYPIISIEDACAEDDWAGWRSASEALGGVQLIGDDLFTTSPAMLQRGIDEAICNAVLVKPNQNGTVSGASRVIELARRAGYATVVSARSGDTEDSWLADLAVGWGAGQIKVGSTTRSERTAKWNRLLAIERELSPAAFAGSAAMAGVGGATRP